MAMGRDLLEGVLCFSPGCSQLPGRSHSAAQRNIPPEGRLGVQLEAEHTCFMPMMWDRDGMHVPPGPGTGCVQDLGALQACLPSSGEFCIKSPNKQNVSLN